MISDTLAFRLFWQKEGFFEADGKNASAVHNQKNGRGRHDQRKVDVTDQL